MIKKLFFILIFLFFSNNSSFAADCSSIDINPQITLLSSYGKLVYDYTKTTEEITSLANSLNISEKDLFASGLSTVNINFDIEINTIGQPIGNSEFCVVPTSIKIFLGLDSPTIYISNELEKNSCHYNIVLRHEQTHQQINKKTLEYYLPLFKNSATKISQTIKPIHITDIESIRPSIKALTEIYNKKLTPLVDYIKKEMLIQQLKLDNPQNYLFESSICP